MSVNELRIDGRIGKDADTRFTSSGACVLRFSIANTERKKSGDQWVDGDTAWYDVEYWPKDDKEALKFVKGAYLCLTGRLKVDKWEKDGTKHTKVKIVMREVESWEFVKAGKPASHEWPRQEPRAETSQPKADPDNFDPSDYETEIPF